MSSHNLLVFSDVHLGSDLVQHTSPGSPTLGPAGVRRDQELVAFLDWYRLRPRAEKPWRLVIAGDFVDFVGMSVTPPEAGLATGPTPEELQHGLGSSCEHTIAKLERVAELHFRVFEALRRFLRAGNSIVIVRGNHDVDFHWPEVQATFRQILTRLSEQSFDARVEFADWFYYEKDVVYIEHGHQYDDFCSTEHLLHPVAPRDPERSLRSLSDVLLRYVVRPTDGLTEAGHYSATATDYVRFAARLGVKGMFGLTFRFSWAVAVAVQIWHEHVTGAADWVRAEHERKMSMLAEAKDLSLMNLRALADLRRPPMTRNLFRLLAGVMVDRVAVFVASVMLLIWVAFARWTPSFGYILAIVASSLFVVSFVWKRTRGTVDASTSLRECAARVTPLFPAAFVVMGHTHQPEVLKSEDTGSTYVNLGSWSEVDGEDGSAPSEPAARTHLVVEHVDGQAVAGLFSWDPEKGPAAFLG